MDASWPYHHVAVRDRTFDLITLTARRFKGIKEQTELAEWRRVGKGVLVGIALEMLLEAVEEDDAHVINKAIARFQERKQHRP